MTLKQKLAEAPVLAYPSFNEPFILETDASSQGLGAILSQRVGQGTPHPIAYGSRSLSKAERNYSITELETLAVVWAITHFHAYLYGNEVTVYTDHSAMRAVLETPNPSGKHAHWVDQGLWFWSPKSSDSVQTRKDKQKCRCPVQKPTSWIYTS